MDRILARANAVELTGWQQKVEQRSRVIWPPVEPPPAAVMREPGISHNSTRVIWPHRWEHDKGPEELLEIADRYSEPLNLRWTILGEQYPDVPPSMAEFEQRFAARIDHFGFEPDRRRYWEHLARADWVLSTARHEYFGIAVAEALLAGCLPWLPQRLSYPEVLPPGTLGLSPQKPPADRQGVLEKIRAHLEPALAPNAVRRIDETIAQAVQTA
jgi:glycosyltransferase involved in cell wall biosynthesis